MDKFTDTIVLSEQMIFCLTDTQQLFVKKKNYELLAGSFNIYCLATNIYFWQFNKIGGIHFGMILL